MKYIKLFLLLLIGFTSVAINASQKDATQTGAFDPEFGVQLFNKNKFSINHNRFNPIARFTIFAPRGGNKKELVNCYSNYLIPSKQEVIEKALDSFQNKAIVSKLVAFVSCTLLEAYKRYPLILEDCDSKSAQLRRVAGEQLLAADLKSENAPAHVKKEARELALVAAVKQAAYDSSKLYAISYLRSKMQPYVNKVVQKSPFLQSINSSHSRSAMAVRYIADRVVYGTLDMGIDAGYSFLKKQLNSK